MTDFDSWLENIVSQANLIASPSALTRAWVDGEKNITSTYDLDELLEQLLGDLHLEEHLLEFGDGLRRLDIFEAVAAFTQAVLSLEEVAKDELCLQNPEKLLSSPQWRELVKSARWVAESPAAKSILKN